MRNADSALFLERTVANRNATVLLLAIVVIAGCNKDYSPTAPTGGTTPPNTPPQRTIALTPAVPSGTITIAPCADDPSRGCTSDLEVTADILFSDRDIADPVLAVVGNVTGPGEGDCTLSRYTPLPPIVANRPLHVTATSFRYGSYGEPCELPTTLTKITAAVQYKGGTGVLAQTDYSVNYTLARPAQ